MTALMLQQSLILSNLLPPTSTNLPSSFLSLLFQEPAIILEMAKQAHNIDTVSVETG